ncbi:hypothetical protein YC2023_052920 [Brassica napus]
MFVALGASVKGYQYMRKVIVVDGTHLKGKYAGCLLTASAQDGNYQIFPLAIASWEWFFKQLKTFVTNIGGLVFVSDRNSSIYKGLSKVKVYPDAGHCICIVHLKRNIRTNFKGRHLPYLVAKAARSYRLEDFYKTFNETKEMDAGCAKYLLDIGFEHWARSHFPGDRFDIMTSNLAESWNAVLNEAREYSVIRLVDYVRGKLTEWFASRRTSANRNNNALSPRVLGIVTRNFEMTGGYEVTNIADGEFEVRDKKGGSFHVKLANKTCSCFAFQMLCIPCPHAIAAALQSGVLVETLVMEAYNVSMLRGAYQERIVPVGDYSGFPENDAIFNGRRLSPPATRRPPGRPKKHRFFSRGEKLIGKLIRHRRQIEIEAFPGQVWKSIQDTYVSENRWLAG